MRLIAKTLRPNGPSLARFFSRQTSQFPPERWHCRPDENPAVVRFFSEIRTRTQDPIWSFLNSLNKPGTAASLAKALEEKKIPLSEYLRWRGIVDSLDADSSIRLERSQDSLSDNVQPPAWALIHLLTYRTHTPLQAQSICEWVLSQNSATSSPLLPSLLTLCIHILASHQLLNSTRLIVSRFLRISRPVLYFQYHLLLKAISSFGPCSEITQLIAMVLDTMVRSGLEIELRTYAALLRSPAISATLARRLQKLMIMQGVTPTPGIIYSFFHIFARRRCAKLSLRYLTAKSHGIHTIASFPFRREKRLHQYEEAFDQSSRDGITLLNSVKETALAFQYLDSISKSKGHRLFTSLDIRGWTSILSLTARGDKVTSRHLLDLFSQIKARNQPTAVTYTVLIRGLTSRRDYNNARTIWNEFLDSGCALDTKSLSAGVETFTLAGVPLEAFRLLEKYAVEPPNASSDKPDEPTHPRVSLTSAFINVFMENFLRINRPDMVFALWDHSETLYCVKPDSSTLNILLSAARIAGKYDDTLPGFMAQFRAQVAATLHSETPSFDIVSRDEVVRIFESMLGTAENKSRKKPTGMWGSTPAWQKATRVFCHAVLGNWPTLLEVSAPAMALRSSADDMGRHPFKELARNILGPPHDDAFTHIDPKSPAALAQLGLYPLGAYPKIFPTEVTFHNYIYLLGLNNQAAQIPLAMAWMRELEIIPTKQTIAIGLVFWAEVSLRAPLLEQWMGEGEYAKFLRWLEDWVGPEKMPGRERMTKTSKIIAKART